MKPAAIIPVWIFLLVCLSTIGCDSDKTIPEVAPVCLPELTRQPWKFAQGTLVRNGLEGDLYSRCTLNFFPEFTPGFSVNSVILELQSDGSYYLMYQLPLSTLSAECRNNQEMLEGMETGNLIRICPDSLAFMPDDALPYGVRATLGASDIWSDEIFLRLGTYTIDDFLVELTFRRDAN
jgi:hypothetical protein